jgi:hypothetical protein
MGLSSNPQWNWVKVTSVTTTSTVPTTTVVSTTVYLLSSTNVTGTQTQVQTTTVNGTSNSTTTTTQPFSILYPTNFCGAPFFVSTGHMMIAAAICSGLAFFFTIGEMLPCAEGENPRRYKSALANLWLILGAILCASSLGRASVGTNCIATYSGTFGNVTVTRVPDGKFLQNMIPILTFD